MRAIYVDHGLQAASGSWSEHCRATCATLQVPFLAERIDVRMQGEESMEAAARRLRYASLRTHMKPDDVLLTAHHENDQAETVLLALLRGTGSHGLAAMPALADFGAGQHARPLLGFSRAALAAYAMSEGLVWVDDLSNRDQNMSRNFLRTDIFPLLAKRWPAATRMLARAATNSADTVELLDEIAAQDLALCAVEKNLSVSPLRKYSPPRRRNIIRFWIRTNNFYPPSSHHLDQILALVDRPPKSGVACIDWPGAEVHYYRDELVVRARLATPDPKMVLAWELPKSVEIPDIGRRLRATPAKGEGLSQTRLAQAAITVRLRQGGETCRLVGREHHRKLKKLLQEANVPPWERERLPLIYAGDELAAVGDRWICAPFAAQADELSWRIVLEEIQ